MILTPTRLAYDDLTYTYNIINKTRPDKQGALKVTIYLNSQLQTVLSMDPGYFDRRRPGVTTAHVAAMDLLSEDHEPISRKSLASTSDKPIV